MQQREGERKKKSPPRGSGSESRWKGKERERKKEKESGRTQVGRKGREERRECWQSMLLIRKARPLLWDQPSLRVRGEPSPRGKNRRRESARRDNSREKEEEDVRGWKIEGGGGSGAREGETEKRARGLFLARPTRGKTPLIGTWLPVGATNSAVRAGGIERG